LLADDAFAIENFAADLRETLLQDSEPAEKELLIAEIATRLCIELAHGVMKDTGRYGTFITPHVASSTYGLWTRLGS
jgi:hypothetical protein